MQIIDFYLNGAIARLTIERSDQKFALWYPEDCKTARSRLEGVVGLILNLDESMFTIRPLLLAQCQGLLCASQALSSSAISDIQATTALRLPSKGRAFSENQAAMLMAKVRTLLQTKDVVAVLMIGMWWCEDQESQSVSTR